MGGVTLKKLIRIWIILILLFSILLATVACGKKEATKIGRASCRERV